MIVFQGPFSLQVNPSAARAGALWQKLIRRGAKLRFGSERAVVDILATFVDDRLGSCGEISEWVDGRNWRFEIDNQVFARGRAGHDAPGGSPEYVAKKRFMAEFVRLLHDMGAPELARQYEWWTCKSQPNVLKRLDAGDGPADGLTALDFRAGLALLPFLPMSPGDIPLILRGLRRGALVQFDRGNLAKLEAFCEENAQNFEDLRPALDELTRVDPEYRASLPDVTHHGLRLVYDRRLVKSVKAGLIQGWQARHFVDEAHAGRLCSSSVRFWVFLACGLVPFLGRFLRRCWGNPAFAGHIRTFLTSTDYMKRTFRAHQAARIQDWLRTGRAGENQVDYFLAHPFVYWRTRCHPVLCVAPPSWHRFLTDWGFARRTIADAVAYPIRFYRDADFRVQWLTNEVESGAAEGMLTPEEEEHILGRVSDPYIQKYLKCVAVHVCTLPITQVVSLVMALWALFFMGKSWAEGTAWALGILAAFQATPISPGSLVRGTYVVYLMIKERNWRNYWIAVLVSYWHYVGYLGFPLQMVGEFPSLARFMAGRWATKMVGVIPVFGERGALFEHWVFDVFFNIPLTLKRRFTRR